jgi:hypothetical protein
MVSSLPPAVNGRNCLMINVTELGIVRSERICGGPVPGQKKMSLCERREYLRLVVPAHAVVGREREMWLLTETGAATKFQRKSLVRRMNARSLERVPKTPGLRRRSCGRASRGRDAQNLREPGLRLCRAVDPRPPADSATHGRVGRLAMATPRGFEPLISTVTGWHVKPLHHGALNSD